MMQKNNVLLETERLLLRRITNEDIPAFYDIMGKDMVMRYLGRTLSNEEIKGYISNISNKDHKDITGEYAIVLKEGNITIGQFGLEIKKRDKRATISYIFNDKYWNNGYAYECGLKVVEFLFSEKKLHKVAADCDIANLPSIKVLEKLGMKKEGTMREHRFNITNNNYYDVVNYGLLNTKKKL